MSDALQELSENEKEAKDCVPFDEDENDISSTGDEGAASSTASLMSHDDASPTITVKKPSSSRPKRRHPPPSLPTASRTRAHSPISTRLKHPLKTQSSDYWSTSDTSSAPLPPPLDDFQQKQHQEADNNNSHHHNHQQQRSKAISAASLVVCGVDGTVYTLDAYTGQLRGMFASGPALVSSSPYAKGENNESAADDDDDHHVENKHAISTNVSPQWEVSRIVPGLDGSLWMMSRKDDVDDDDANYFNDGECDDDDGACDEKSNQPDLDSYDLIDLEISVMDVVDSPISSTCGPQEQQCGIVVGSKKTTVYAIDPITGKVRWTQDPHGGGGGRGFTTHPPPNVSSRGLTVLLQREDYAVRHVNTDGGGEVWKVELGRFSALAFDIGAHRDSAGRDDMDESSEGEQDQSVVGVSRRRTSAAAAANVGLKDKKTTPILGGTRNYGSLNDQKERHHVSKIFHQEDSFDRDHSHFRGFPSVAFGEDGTTLMAVDGISGELLWKHSMQSVVAAVYGVGKESTWIPLKRIKESDVINHGHNNGHNSVITRQEISPLTLYKQSGNPFGNERPLLGRYQSSIFVSTFDPLGLDPSEGDELSIDPQLPLQPRANGQSYAFSPADSAIFPPGMPPKIMIDGMKPPLSHRTEHGVYLTWSIVYGILAVLIGAIVLVRAKYMKQKRKWENTPSLDPTAPSGSDDGIGKNRSLKPDGIMLPPSALRVNAFDDLRRSKDRQPVLRSLSLGAMIAPSGTYEQKHFKSVAGKDDVNSSPILPREPGEKSLATTTNLTTNDESPKIVRSKTLPPDSPPDKAQLQQPDNIDGIPLVRYSRYRFEFKELSPLGRGGFGTVFRCENSLDSREYAIKKIWIKSQLDLDGKVTKHFSHKLHRVLREVKILALLDHPNIVRYYTAWLEVDDGSKTDDEETDIAHSTLDKKTSSFFSGSLFGFASASKHVSSPYSAKRSVQQRSTGLFGSYVTNPLGWNNFGSFRLDESNSERNSSERISSTPKHEDDGFTWERSKENTAEQSLFAGLKPSSSKLINEVVNEEKNESYSEVSNVDEVESAHDNPHESEVDTQCKAKRENKTVETGQDESTLRTVAASEGRHILFIQMQLCSVQTLADFLADHEARIGSMSSSLTQANHYAVDIPFALRLFKQIANGVKYVHKQGLIHRDLKPQNCFIDEAGNVKVGDFGLSRVNTNTNAIGASNDYDSDQDGDYSTLINNEQSCAADAENTAGVGTRAYASPEQMRGSIYDASTDIYSLGIILFEMCYPMYTAMERYERFSDIRKGTFPPYWINSVKKSFPAMHDLLIRMISDSASERPSAAAVFYEIDSLLSEYSVQSLDKSWGKKGAILLRVEADDNPGILSDAMRLIKEAAPSAKILQYGLRGQASKAIMEFALDAHSAEEDIAGKITLALDANDMSVRRILAA